MATQDNLQDAFAGESQANRKYLAFAEKAEADSYPQVAKLFRAAAACSGGCNHGPLEPDGWDRAIAIYQTIVDTWPDTPHATNALWAQASCCGCWSPQAGCDSGGVGKRE